MVYVEFYILQVLVVGSFLVCNEHVTNAVGYNPKCPCLRLPRAIEVAAFSLVFQHS